MKNTEIVEVLKDIAYLLKCKKENHFKVRAYERVAAAIEQLSVDVERLVREDRLKEIPGVGEETILSCRIRSIVDVSDYSVKISFAKRLEDNSILKVPGENILVEGDLEWRGDLKKNEPVEFSATIIFPEEGDWRILVVGDCISNDKLEFADSIEMNITGDISS